VTCLSLLKVLAGSAAQRRAPEVQFEGYRRVAFDGCTSIKACVEITV